MILLPNPVLDCFVATLLAMLGGRPPYGIRCAKLAM
jgi:hypothetical protein